MVEEMELLGICMTAIPLISYYLVFSGVLHTKISRGEIPHLQHQLSTILATVGLSYALALTHVLALFELYLNCMFSILVTYLLAMAMVVCYWFRATEDALDALELMRKSIGDPEKGIGNDRGKRQPSDKRGAFVSKQLAGVLKNIDKLMPRDTFASEIGDPPQDRRESWARETTLSEESANVDQILRKASRSRKVQKGTRVTPRNVAKAIVFFGSIYVALVLASLLPINEREWFGRGCMRAQPFLGLYIFVVSMQGLVAWTNTARICKPNHFSNEFTICSAALTITVALSLLGDFAEQYQLFPGTWLRAGAWVAGSFVCFNVTVLFPLLRSTIVESDLASFTPAYFDHVLHDPILFAEFKEILKTDYCLENGCFFEEATRLASQMAELPIGQDSRSSPSDQEKEFMDQLQVLCSKYVFVGGSSELNIPSKVRTAVIRELDNGSPGFNVLVPVLKEVCQMMYRNNFPKFVNQKRKEGGEA